MLVIAPVGETEPQTYACGICGFVMHAVGECPRCKLIVQQADELADARARRRVRDQLEDLLAGIDI